MTLSALKEKLIWLQSELLCLGNEMRDAGIETLYADNKATFSIDDIGLHGIELIGAAEIVQNWIDTIEQEIKERV